MTDNQSDRDWIRKGALEEIESLKLVRATLWEEHTHSFRWLMASLLAVNGAGLWAGFGADEVPSIFRVSSGALFLFGSLSALLIAVNGQRSAQAMFGPLNEYIGYWIGVAGDGERFEELENSIQKKMEPAINIGKRSRVLGWGSAISFVLGICLLAGGYISSDLEQPLTQKAIPSERSQDVLPRANRPEVADDQ